jgi:Zn-dependent protease
LTSLLFTEDAQAALDFATRDARKRHNLFVDIENLMLGLLQQQSEPLKGTLADINRAQLAEQISQQMGMVREDPLDESRGFSKELQSLLVDAGNQAQMLGHDFVNGGHLLLAMFHVRLGPLADIMPKSGLYESIVREQVSNNSPKPKNPGRRVQAVPAPQPKPRPQQGDGQSETVSTGVYIALGVIVALVYMAVAEFDIFVSFGLVIIGWIFSLTLHEFSHAAVAYLGGDYTVREKGYLTFNPLKYTHPLLSIGLPLLFLALGGIGLPGGAVYIEVHRLRSKHWRTAVSLAGPASNALMAVVFAAPFWLGMMEFHPENNFRVESALAFMVWLQITAVILNLLPIPPLDGFNAISPYLPPEVVMQMRRYGFLPIILLFFLFGVPEFANPFFDSVQQLMEALQVPYFLGRHGLDLFRFWDVAR